jgi:hypothetical protein
MKAASEYPPHADPTTSDEKRVYQDLADVSQYKELPNVDQSLDFYGVVPSLHRARILSNERVPVAHLQAPRG